MALFSTLTAQTPQGEQLRAGLLGMGAGLLQGSTGHYGQFAPAFGQGLLGFGMGQQQAQENQMRQGLVQQKQQQAQQEQMQQQHAQQWWAQHGGNLTPETMQAGIGTGNPYLAEMIKQAGSFMPKPDEPTTLMRNIAAAGLQPGTPEYYQAIMSGIKAPSTTVNVGQSEYGTIPPGYELFTDPVTGARSMRPIAGGPVDREEQDAATRAEAARVNAANYAKTVTQDIGVALQELENQTGMSTWDNPLGGIAAETRSSIPRTSQYNMKQFVDSALSNVTLDTMNRMRESSPAGATGFGNMSERQMEVIRGVLGQWKPGLPVDQQRYILHRLHNFYMDVVVGSRAEREQAVRDGRMTQAEADALDELYYPETRDLKGQPLSSQSDPSSERSRQLDSILGF